MFATIQTIAGKDTITAVGHDRDDLAEPIEQVPDRVAIGMVRGGPISAVGDWGWPEGGGPMSGFR